MMCMEGRFRDPMGTQSKPIATNTVPTLTDGQPPAPEIRDNVVRNQTRTAMQWHDTAEDMVLGDIIREREEVRQSHWQMVVLTLVVIAVLVLGSIWTYNNVIRDRMTESNRTAGNEMPFQPETINTVK